jgi:hypothetical protein
MRGTLSLGISGTAKGVHQMINLKTKRLSRRLVISLGCAAAAIYITMVTVTLAHLESLSGQIPFDLRPFGYNRAVAAAFLDALGAEGRAYYLTRQIPLDMAYPALLALTLGAVIAGLSRSLHLRGSARIGIALTLCVAACDYAENAAISAMIVQWPELPNTLAVAASCATVSKSVLTVGVVSWVMVLCLLWANQRRRKSTAFKSTRH